MKKNRIFFTEEYLKNRPAFFSLLRPVEAELIYKNSSFLGKKILDFGCGDGFFANLVFSKKSVDVGLDIGQSRINQAEDKKVYKKIKKYNGKKIPFPENYFTGVFSNSVLEHVVARNLEKNVSEIFRVLQPNGYFLTTVMTANWDKYLLGGRLLGKKFGEKYRNWLKKDQDHENLLTAKEWEKVFERAGFKVAKKVGYLNKKTSNWLEIWHYLSYPSVLFFKFLRKWVPWDNWYLLFNLHYIFEKINKKSFVSTNKASSVFFVLRKKK